MLAKRMAVAGFLVPLILAPRLAGQRTPLARPQVLPQQHDHTQRLKSIGALQQLMVTHGSFLNRLATDHAFADQVEAATENGDAKMLTTLFAQATGVPVSNILVKPSGATGLGAREAAPEFRIEPVSNWTRATGSGRVTRSSLRPMGAGIAYCFRGWCIWLRKETTEDG